jgi:mannose-6-phosphate isomerase class I
MYKDFGLDIGIIVSFLLNYFDLPVGKSFYLKAGLPHAYI